MMIRARAVPVCDRGHPGWRPGAPSWNAQTVSVWVARSAGPAGAYAVYSRRCNAARAPVKRWLARRPRFHVHFTPISASWINAVEGLFATLTKRDLKRGVFRSVIELNQAIQDYLNPHNADPKPFRWTAPADTIIGKHQRGKRLLESLQ